MASRGPGLAPGLVTPPHTLPHRHPRELALQAAVVSAPGLREGQWGSVSGQARKWQVSLRSHAGDWSSVHGHSKGGPGHVPRKEEECFGEQLADLCHI